MRRPGQQDILIVVTSPTGVENPHAFSPFEVDDPEDLVFCCFFKELDQRTEFLKRLRTIAGTPLPPDTDLETMHDQLAQEHARLLAEGASGEAFFTTIRWWTGVMRRGYHTYSLRVGFAPFRTSCIIAFRELDTAFLRMNLARGLQFLEREKQRVLDAFGLGGRN